MSVVNPVTPGRHDIIVRLMEDCSGGRARVEEGDPVLAVQPGESLGLDTEEECVGLGTGGEWGQAAALQLLLLALNLVHSHIDPLTARSITSLPTRGPLQPRTAHMLREK